MVNWTKISGSAASTEEDIRVDLASFEDALEVVGGHLDRGEGFSLATLNLDHLVKIRTDPAFRTAYQRQTHVTADGRPIVWLSKLAGQQVSLVPGSELIEPLAALAARKEAPIALLGSTEDTLAATATVLEAKYPGLIVAAQIAPAMGFDPGGDDAQAAIKAIEASGARLCFLALGAPKQELLAARAQNLSKGVGYISIGAGLDFIAGSQVRAPKLFRALALEWLWRLASNPRRLASRYAKCFAILPRAFGLAIAGRRVR